MDVGRAITENVHQWYDGEVECDVDSTVETLEVEAGDILKEEVKEKLNKLPVDIVISDDTLDGLFTCPYGIENLVESYLSDDTEERDIIITHSESTFDKIDAIFER